MVGLNAKDQFGEVSLWDLRAQLHSQSNIRFVDPIDFCTLAVSCQKITRADHPAAGLKGLYSEDEAITYYVEEERLDRFRYEPQSVQPGLELV